jgi:hypothetical protein
MRRDCHGSVTRDMRVTSQVRGTRDERDMSRVSHATTTTPHHTFSVVTSVRGGCGDFQDQSTVCIAPAAIGFRSYAK